MRERVITIARGAAHLEAEGGGGPVFVWKDRESAATWSQARFPATAQDIRPLEDIAKAELAAAFKGLETEQDAETAVARRFGVRRLSSPARERLISARPNRGHYAR